jgi:GNAT superfamily N-acetyltransferase
MNKVINEVTIRCGKPSDVSSLLALIKELAQYEKAPNEVIVTEEILLNDGFGQNPIFKFFVAEHQKQIVGIALYYIKYSTWKGRCIFLEDIVVKESYRQKGIGQLLFNEVCKVAKNEQVQRLEWQVLNWNTPAINFYKKNKATFDDEWINCKLTFNDLQSLPL